MGLVQYAASQTLASSAVFVFITVLLMAAAKRTSTCIVLFSAQCAIITAQTLAIAYANRSSEALIVAAMLLAVKVLAIPYLLFRIIDGLKAPREVTASTSSAQSVFIAAGLILLSFLVVQPYVRTLQVHEDILAAAVALVLSGCFLMVSR